jgi:hypothetical protein
MEGTVWYNAISRFQVFNMLITKHERQFATRALQLVEHETLILEINV